MGFGKGAAWNGNAAQTFRAGNKFRWPKGQSGNPVGKPAGLVAFEHAFAEALSTAGKPEELAAMIWTAARKGEAWAVLKLAERFEWPRVEEGATGDVHIEVTYVERQQNNFIAPNGAADTIDAPRATPSTAARLERGPAV
jgi:hypothetical protein